MVKIIIVDDHPIVLKGLNDFLINKGFDVVATFHNSFQAAAEIPVLKVDIIITDLSMPNLNGLELIEQLINQKVKAKYLIYTMFSNKSLLDSAMRLGVLGYMLKEFALDEIEECILNINKGERWISPKLNIRQIINGIESDLREDLGLTQMEKKIVSLIAEEKSSKEIADLLFLSEKTIENHRSNIIKKLNLSNSRTSLISWALRNKSIFTQSMENKSEQHI